MTDQPLLGWILIIGISAWAIYSYMQDQELLKKNPEAWRAKHLIEEEKKIRKRESYGKMAGSAVKWFFKK